MTEVGRIIRSLLDRAGDTDSLPALLCQEASRRLPIERAGICVMDEAGDIELLVGSDPLAVRLEELQLTLGEGPCRDAWGSGRLALYPDIDAEVGRWPAYAMAVRELGVRSMFSLPLHIGGIRLGVLDLFGERPGTLGETDLAAALHFGDAAVLILLHLHLQGLGATEADQADPRGPLEVTFRDQSVVHQATGMVAIQAGVGLASALVMLRAHAFATDRSLSEVARDVVERRLDFR